MSRPSRPSLVQRSVLGLGALAGLVLLAGPAQAHHLMGGNLPSTFAEGLLSGLGHPIIGLDHFAFVIGVGLAAATLPRRALMPLAFVVMTIVGVVVHLSEANLPLVEVVISLSVLAVGVLLLSGKAVGSGIWLALFAVAGLFHGYAYGESIVGAEPSPLFAYFIGFAAIQYAIAMGAIWALVNLTARESAIQSLRIAGGVVAGVGLVFASQAIMPF